MPLEERGGFPVYWTQQTGGTRDALLIHCSLAHQGAWGGLIPELSDIASFTAFDLPGHGRSGNWTGQGDIHEAGVSIAADFIDGPMDVIGHSFGAVIAMGLALKQPDKLRSLTLIEPVLFAAVKLDNSDSFAEHLADHDLFRQALAQGHREEAARGFARIWGTGQPWQTIAPEQRQYMVDRIHLVPRADAQLFDDKAAILPRLPELKMPVLLIEGESSPPPVHKINAALASRMPDAQRETIAGASHMLPITHPAETAAAIRQFWAGSAPDQ